jgi:hypothetical protein
MKPTRFPRHLGQIRPSPSSSPGYQVQRLDDGPLNCSAFPDSGAEARKGVSVGPNHGRTRVARRGVRRYPVGEGLEDRLVLSTFQVNSLLDTVAVNLKTGKDATGHISLRSAIMAADSKGGSNKINLPSGTITLTLAGANEDASATGDLDIRDNLTITGKGAGRTIINGNALDRVFQVLGGKVTIAKVTIEGGQVTGDGGGILNSGGQLSLSSVNVLENIAFGRNSTTVGSAGGDVHGGGIANISGSLSITNSTIADNEALGGIGGNGAHGANSTVVGGIDGTNGHAAVGGDGTAGGDGGIALGGGIYNDVQASLSVSGTTIRENDAHGGNGGAGGAGGQPVRE